MDKRALVIQLAKWALTEHEGVRYRPYNDHLGNCTVGVGHLLHKGPCTLAERLKTYSKAEVDAMLAKDIDTAVQDARYWLGASEFDKLSVMWQLAVTCMSFQLGYGTLMKFKETRKALLAHDVALIVKHANNSLWAKQTPKRVEFFCSLIINNCWRNFDD